MSEQRTEWPEFERYSDIPLFNMKAMVQQTGIAAPTLRAWERRYAILSPERANNAYRLYSERDIVIIRWLKERVDAGMSISQAVALFRHLQEVHRQASREEGPQAGVAFFPSGENRPQAIAENDEQEVGRQWELDDAQGRFLNVQTSDAEGRGNDAPAMYSMPRVQERLLKAFNELDEAAASRLMAGVLAIYPVEQVCMELIAPTLWEIGQMWEQGRITVSVEHFASAFFHGLLTNLFHALPMHSTGPLVITCCAPGEMHELGALMLSMLLRRAGLHVAYLGQSIETEGLMHTVRELCPKLLCVSVTLVSYLEAMITLGQRIEALPTPRPLFVFGGQVFERYPNLIARVPGVYLDANVQTIIGRIQGMASQ